VNVTVNVRVIVNGEDVTPQTTNPATETEKDEETNE